MEPVNFQDIDFSGIVDALGGGWAAVVIAGILMLIFGYLKIAERKAKRDQVKKDTAKAKAEDQATLPEKNQKVQDDWDKASNEIDEIRKKHRENQ